MVGVNVRVSLGDLPVLNATTEVEGAVAKVKSMMVDGLGEDDVGGKGLVGMDLGGGNTSSNKARLVASTPTPTVHSLCPILMKIKGEGYLRQPGPMKALTYQRSHRKYCRSY